MKPNNKQITKSVTINAEPALIWKTLTNPDLMRKWIGDEEMEIEIFTNWQIGKPIITKGFHHVRFENTGTVLKFETNRILSYNYLSSISRLPDVPESYTIIEFQLEPVNNQTLLTVSITNFPTETIFKHLNLYWGTTLEIIKKQIENGELKPKQPAKQN